MSTERRQELQEQLYQLERRIRPLEWDANRNQINEFKKAELARLLVEQASLANELKSLEQAQAAENQAQSLEPALKND
ncbi:MAG: hypothetical protein AABX13_01980 [Nanoarchaeota archaeon]